MITPKDFVNALKNKGFYRFSGVPCSFFQAAINYILESRELTYTMCPNEGSALALAAGAELVSKPTAVLIQNSGFGNLINPLTSLNMIYKIPVLIFMSGRAYGVEDEPQHEVMGRVMAPMLQAMGVEFEDMPKSILEFEESLARACQAMRQTQRPFFFLVPKGVLEEYCLEQKTGEKYPLKRMEAIQIIMESLKGDEFVVATTGKPSRELFAAADKPGNFYMQGSMGHAPSIALGVAMAKTDQKVVVLDGDGALLMHLGVLSTAGHYKPQNLTHIVLDNEAYETTGNQDTTSSSADLELIARAAGYFSAETVRTADELKAALGKLPKAKGPRFIRVKINRLPSENIPRISSKYSSFQITNRSKLFLSQ